MPGPVDVRTECDPLLRDLSESGKRENLVAAGIGEDIASPARESVDAASRLNHIQTRSEHEMVGVGQYQAVAKRFKPLVRHRLDRGSGPNRHEGRDLHRTVRQREDPGSCCRLTVGGVYIKNHVRDNLKSAPPNTKNTRNPAHAPRMGLRKPE